MSSRTVLRCSMLGDRALLRLALELVPVAERQGCDAIEIWRNHHPSCLYYVSTLRQFMRARETDADLEAVLASYKTPSRIRGRQCRGKQVDALLDKLMAEAPASERPQLLTSSLGKRSSASRQEAHTPEARCIYQPFHYSA